MRVLVTGGAGFIGSHLCEHFLSEGHNVIALDNLITGSLRNIEHLRINPQFEFMHQDASEPFTVEGELDAVLHFASPASPPDYLRHPIETLKVGSYATHNALELCRHKNARFLMASTSEIYGDPLEHPQRETYSGNVETMGVRAVYDEAKRYAEVVTMAYHRYFGLNTHIVRIFNTYGPRMRLDDGRVVPNFIAQALANEPLTVYGDGQQTRSFQYVADLIHGLHLLLMSDYHEPVNIGNPHEMTILEFAEAVQEVSGSSSGIVMKPQDRIAGDPQVRRPDITRAQQVLGWQPKVALADGLKLTIDYFRNHIHGQ